MIASTSRGPLLRGEGESFSVSLKLRDWICRMVIPRRKEVLKTRAVQTLCDCRASSNGAERLEERLECGAFTAAFFSEAGSLGLVACSCISRKAACAGFRG